MTVLGTCWVFIVGDQECFIRGPIRERSSSKRREQVKSESEEWDWMEERLGDRRGVKDTEEKERMKREKRSREA